MAKVKICGNTNPEDAALAKEHGADFLGLIFTESKRKVTIEQAQEIMAAVPRFDAFVGVFANQPKEAVEAALKALNLKWVQFHGNETAHYCDYFTHKKINVIKTFRARDKMSLKRIDEYNVAAYLFDTYSGQESGGTGIPFDWSLIEDTWYVHEKLFLACSLRLSKFTLTPWMSRAASKRNQARKMPFS